MINYSMTPLGSGTRLRVDHNTFADVITSYGTSHVVQGDTLWIAPADGAEVKKDDKWLHVTHVNGAPVTQGWMTYIHKGIPYCNNFQDLTGGTPPPPPPPPTPEASDIIVTVDQGMKQVSVKARDGQPLTGWTIVT